MVRSRRAGPRSVLAGLHPALRPGTHVPFLQAGAGLNHCAGAHSRAGRPLDLADAGRLHPAAAGPSAHRRHAAALGTPVADRPADSNPHPPRFPPAAAGAGHPGQSTETLRTLTRTPQRQPARASTTPSRHPQGRRLKLKGKLHIDFETSSTGAPALVVDGSRHAISVLLEAHAGAGASDSTSIDNWGTAVAACPTAIFEGFATVRECPIRAGSGL